MAIPQLIHLCWERALHRQELSLSGPPAAQPVSVLLQTVFHLMAMARQQLHLTQAEVVFLVSIPEPRVEQPV